MGWTVQAHSSSLPMLTCLVYSLHICFNLFQVTVYCAHCTIHSPSSSIVSAAFNNILAVPIPLNITHHLLFTSRAFWPYTPMWSICFDDMLIFIIPRMYLIIFGAFGNLLAVQIVLNVTWSDLLAQLASWSSFLTWCIHFDDALVPDACRMSLSSLGTALYIPPFCHLACLEHSWMSSLLHPALTICTDVLMRPVAFLVTF